MVWPEYICLFFLIRPQFEKINTKNFPFNLLSHVPGFCFIYKKTDKKHMITKSYGSEKDNELLLSTFVFITGASYLKVYLHNKTKKIFPINKNVLILPNCQW